MSTCATPLSQPPVPTSAHPSAHPLQCPPRVMQTTPSLGRALGHARSYSLPCPPHPPASSSVCPPLAWVRGGMWRWGGRGQKATCESGSKARMGIRSDRAWAGAHLCRLGCGRCGSGGQAPGRGAAGSGGSAAAPLHHRRRCSPPRGPRSPTAPALSRRAPPGTEGCPPRRCWVQEWAVRRQGPPARLAAQASLVLLAHQLSHGPVTTSPGSRLSQELSPDPTERLWFSGIPEGTGGEAGASDGSANHQRCSGLYPAVSTHGDLGLGRRRTQKPQRVPALECGSCPCWPPWAKWQGPGRRALLC